MRKDLSNLGQISFYEPASGSNWFQNFYPRRSQMATRLSYAQSKDFIELVHNEEQRTVRTLVDLKDFGNSGRYA